jgi:hypothetical protein
MLWILSNRWLGLGEPHCSESLEAIGRSAAEPYVVRRLVPISLRKLFLTQLLYAFIGIWNLCQLLEVTEVRRGGVFACVCWVDAVNVVHMLIPG